jgi:hypothetical protein
VGRVHRRDRSLPVLGVLIVTLSLFARSLTSPTTSPPTEVEQRVDEDLARYAHHECLCGNDTRPQCQR